MPPTYKNVDLCHTKAAWKANTWVKCAFSFFSFTFFLGSVTRNDTEPTWRVELNVCGKTVNFKADSGVDVTAISTKTFTPLTAEPAVATPNNPRGSVNTNSKSCNFNTCA